MRTALHDSEWVESDTSPFGDDDDVVDAAAMTVHWDKYPALAKSRKLSGHSGMGISKARPFVHAQAGRFFACKFG